jgi:hypothetical protein
MRSFLLALLLALPAVAEDSPCKRQGDLVVCRREGFDVLVAKTVSFKAEAEKAAARIVAMEAQSKADASRIDLLVAERELGRAELAACKARPFPTRKMLWAAGIGFGGGLAVATAPQVSSEVIASGLLVAGAAGLVTSAVLVLSE